MYEPGKVNAYHAYTFGWILGETVRRSDPQARPFNQYIQDELCQPLGIDSLFLGVPPEREDDVIDLVYPSPPPPPAEGDPRWAGAPREINFTPAIYNLPLIRRACIPGAGGIANALSIARLFSLIAGRGEVDGIRLLSADQVTRFLGPRPDHESKDPIYGGTMLVGMGGIMVHPRGVVDTHLEERVVCQVGSGSSLGWADLDSGLSLAFCHNRMVVNPVMAQTRGDDVPTPPFVALGEALREVAAERSSYTMQNGRPRGAAVLHCVRTIRR